MMQEDNIEQGVGPINLGLSPVQLEDGLNELNEN